MDWIAFLTDNFIVHVSSGPRTTRGHVEIKCPFCGENDPSFHLGINLTTNQWNCWRDNAHRGATPYRLISALLGVSGAQAKLTVQAYSGASIDSFDAPQAPTKLQQQPIMPIKWPDEFETPKGVYCDYLLRRGFDAASTDYYCLAACRIGRWKQRIIIPVYDEKWQLLGWQGRAIVEPKKAPRYLTSHEQVKRTIFNLQNISKGGEALYVFEGPIDTLRVDWLGKPKIRATCTFGVSFTSEQVLLLSRLSSKFQRMVLCFDSNGDAAGIAGGFALNDWLPNSTFGTLPEGHKDTDNMNKAQLMSFIHARGT